MSKPSPEAVRKKYGSLEVWEWFEEGVRKIELTGEGCLSDSASNSLSGEFIGEDHYEIILQEDADVYLPRDDDLLSMFADETSEEDRLLASFRKGVISTTASDTAWDNLYKAATISDNRGQAAGPIDPRFIRRKAQQGNLVMLTPNRAKYILPDGALGKTTIANEVRSNIVGNFDAGPRVPFCRQTAWTKTYPERVSAFIPYLQELDDCFKRQAPEHYARQRAFVDSGPNQNGWTLGGTVYTTVTVNRNWQTACHKDAGDYPLGFGNLTVVEKRPYSGGYTGFPKFKVAVDVRTGDYLAMNVHEWHCNTELRPVNPPPEGGEWETTLNPRGDHGFDRLSFVCYARNGMSGCGTQKEENVKYGRHRKTWLRSSEKAEVLMRKRQEAADEANAEISRMRELFEDT